MRFNKSTDIYIPGPEVLRFKCGNLRTAFLAFDLIFLLFALVFLCQVASHLGSNELSAKARAINDFFGTHSAAFMAGPVVILGTLMYFAYARNTISWQDGLQIDDRPQQQVSYQFKSFFGGVPLIYLEAKGRLYILYPATSQDGRKFPDAEIIRKETAENQVKVALLKNKLTESGAIAKRFWFFTWDVGVSFLAFLLVILIAFLGN